MLLEIKPYLDWLQLHPHWGGLIAGAVAFIESLVVLGLLIPGTVMMTAVGTLIGAGVLPFTTTTLWAIGGAILGDVLSFWLGHHYHQHLKDFWPFRTHPKILEKGEQFFLTHGRKGIFIGRFVGPIRPILPVIAGMMSMPTRRFLFADIISGILWAPVYMAPGILLGAASKELPPQIATKLILFVVVALLAFWCLSWLLKKVYSWLMGLLDAGVAWLWKFTANHPRLYVLKEFLLDPSDPHNHNQLALALLLVSSGIAFICIAYSVFHHAWLTSFNDSVYYFMRSLRSTTADKFFIIITSISTPVYFVFWIATFAWLALRRYWRAAWHWLLLGALAFCSTELLKHAFHNPRPSGLLVTPAGWSFPSGHSTLSTAFFGFFAVLVTRMRAEYWRWIAYSIATLLAGAIIFSRVYLGAHWLTDVIGGALLGYSIVLLMTLSYRRKSTTTIAPAGILIVGLLSLCLSWGWNVRHTYEKSLHDYTPFWTNQIIDAKRWWLYTSETIPQYRFNRFGKAIELFNVQWAGDLFGIKEELTKHGWQILPKASFLRLVSEFAGKNNEQQITVMSQFYEDRKPVLIMTKYLSDAHAILVLRLWHAHLALNNGKPLWLGTVAYHTGWRSRIAKKHKHHQKALLPLPTTVLASDIATLPNKTIAFPRPETNTMESVLFVESK